MTRELVGYIQHFVEQSTVELAERLASSLEPFADWDAVPGLPYTPSANLDMLLNEIARAARWAGKSPAEVAFSLRTACATAARYRDWPRIELVISGPSVPPFEMRRTDETLLQMIGESRKRLTLISFALYRVDRLAEALTQAVLRGVETRLFVESDTLPDDSIRMIYGDAVAAQMRVYVWTESRRPQSLLGRTGVLHAKATIADGEELFISSANLTEHAMSLNIELGVLIRGGDHAQKIEQLLDTYVARGLFEKLSD